MPESGIFHAHQLIDKSLVGKGFQEAGLFSMSHSDYADDDGLQQFRHLESLPSRPGQRTEFFTAHSPNGSFIGTTLFGRV
jgi:hypothetical protein